MTSLRFTDTNPVFTRDGKYLAFLSVRSLDPVYDAFSFDLSFPVGSRPHIIALTADTPSPFDPVVGGRPLEPPGPELAAKEAVAEAAPDDSGDGVKEGTAATQARPAPPSTRLDADGLEHRIVAAPVEAGRYSSLAASKHGLVWLREPLRGELGENLATVDAEPEQARAEHLDLRTGKLITVVEKADRIQSTADGSRLLVVDRDRLSIVPSDKAPASDADTADGDDSVVRVDLDRVRIEVDPPLEWRQMFDETWRLMRDNFWRADMGGRRLASCPRALRAAASPAGLARRPARRDLGDAR